MYETDLRSTSEIYKGGLVERKASTKCEIGQLLAQREGKLRPPSQSTTRSRQARLSTSNPYLGTKRNIQ